jgi:hypothetical protein
VVTEKESNLYNLWSPNFDWRVCQFRIFGEMSSRADFWNNFGAAQGRLETRKRNRSNDLD